MVTAADIADVTSSALAAIASKEVCEEYCAAIEWMCKSGDENRAACGAGVATAVLAMMEAHLEPRSSWDWLVYRGCDILGILVENVECAEAMRADSRTVGLLRQAVSPSSVKVNAAKILAFLDAPEVRDSALRARQLCVWLNYY